MYELIHYLFQMWQFYSSFTEERTLIAV